MAFAVGVGAAGSGGERANVVSAEAAVAADVKLTFLASALYDVFF